MARKELWSWVKSLVLAVVLALLIRENVLAFYVVDGNSMLPTLQNGQMVAVNKLVYKIRSPHHGDVVVFVTKGPAFGLSEGKVFIKRVIALPGDIIEISEGEIFLNGQHLEEEYTDVEMIGNLDPIFIEEGQIFVMGDNRMPTGSWDSREFGQVAIETILGRADLVVFPVPGKVD